MRQTWDRARWRAAASWAFWALCFGVTAVYLCVGYGAYLDADMSSELTLAQHLAQRGALVSGTWYYSTEVRLLSTQLVFTPLMALLGGSWRAVRTVGCLLLLAMLSGSVFACARAIGARRDLARVFAGLSVLVTSPLYAQNVIIGAYYIPHAMLTLGALALAVPLAAPQPGKRPRLRAAALSLLGFVLGFCSPRYLLDIALPLFLAAVWGYVFPAERADAPRTRAQRRLPLAVLGMAVCAAAGYALGCRVLPAHFHYNPDYYGSTVYADWAQHDLPAQVQSVLGGLLEALGFTGGVPVFSAPGVVNALILLTLLCWALLLARGLRTCRADAPACLALRMLLCCAALSFGLFVLARGVYFSRYWLPVLMLGTPVWALCLSRETNRVFARAALCLLVGTALCSSALCMRDSLRHPQVQEEMRMEAVTCAQALGLDKGYATCWNANILTELTDGALDVVAVEQQLGADGERTLRPFRWMEAEDSFALDRPDDPVFLLLGIWEEDGMAPFLAKVGAQKHTLAGYIHLYVIPSQRILLEAMGEI